MLCSTASSGSVYLLGAARYQYSAPAFSERQRSCRASQVPKSLIELADELYRQRDSTEKVKESLDLLNEARSHSPDFDIDWRVRRAYFF